MDIGIWYSTWYARTKEFSEDNKENTWTAWKIPYKPLLPDGTYDTYDSMDEKVLLFHLEEIARAEIDFILFDQTNHIDVDNGYINQRTLKMAEMIQKFNQNPKNRPVRYCSAVGGIQWDGNPAIIEEEAQILWDRYDLAKSNHYYLDGKPLMVVYLGNIPVKVWEEYTGNKEYANRFTLRFANNDSEPGYWGWAYDKGTQFHWETVVVMPGWDNQKGATPVKRKAGEWYHNAWKPVLEAAVKPQVILINSFNEYAEGTAVFPADTSGFPIGGDVWVDENGQPANTLYWERTKDYIRQSRNVQN